MSRSPLMPPGHNMFSTGMDQLPTGTNNYQSFMLPMPATLMVLTPFSHSLLARAKEEGAKGNTQFAVVLAQAACELATEDALNELMRVRSAEYLSDSILGIFKTTNLTDDRLRGIFAALAGEGPESEVWWESYREAQKVRHSVAHEGKQVSTAQAQSAIAAADSCIGYFAIAIRRARIRLREAAP
jgi:hypothetical protein